MSRRVIPRELVNLEIDNVHESGLGSAKIIKDRIPVSNSKIHNPVKNGGSKVRGVNLVIINHIVEERIKEYQEQFGQEKEQSYQEGLKQGEARGIDLGHQAVDKLEKLLLKISNESNARVDRFFKEVEGGIQRLSMEIAEAIIGEAASRASGDILERNLKRCLSVLKGSGQTKIRINPTDYDFLKEKTQLLEQSTKNKFIFEFEPDASIAPGGCYLETAHGAVDGRLESQFELLRDSFLEI
jgi:flagellar biosynthesis/type III secretory pathway protein FliH